MRKILLLFSVFLHILLLSAQTSPNEDGTLPTVFPPSPETASLGSYIDTPTSYATGVPNISVPILELKGKVPIPISLSYHAGGIKVASFASRVGLGWNLNAGGKITRSVRGGSDDGGNQSGYLGYAEPNVTTIEDIEGSSDKQSLINQNSDDDFQSDIYNYSFMGHSGSFFLEQETNATIPEFPVSIVQNPKTDNRIVPTMAGGDLVGWTIVTPDGTKYYFGRSRNNQRSAVNTANTFSISGYQFYPNSNSHSYNESWELMDIQTINNDITSFHYQSKNTFFRTLTGEHYIFDKPQNNQSLQYSENTNKSYYLVKVTNTNGRIDLDYNHNRIDLDNDVALTDLILYDFRGVLVDHYTFEYDYFESLSSTLNTVIPTVDVSQNQRLKRLKLEGVSQIKNNDTNKQYKFTYNTLTKLPGRLSFAQDYWGFFNGKTGNNHFFPKVQYRDGNIIIENNIGGDRSVHLDKTKAWVLNKIQYPTGGYTEYEYELNRVNSLPAPLALSFNAFDAVTLVEDLEINPGTTNTVQNIAFNPSVYTGGVFIQVTNGPSGCEYNGQFGCPKLEIFAVDSNNNEEKLFTYFGKADSENTFPLSENIDQIRIEYSSSAGQGTVIPKLDIYGYKKPRYGFEVGGLRVKEIASYTKEGDLAKNEEIKYTQFSDPTKSSGVVTTPPVFVLRNGHSEVDSSINQITNYDILRSSVLLPLTNYGANVSYEEVSNTLSGKHSGKTEKVFHVPENPNPGDYSNGIYSCTPECLKTLIPSLNLSHRQGLLKKEKFYSQDGPFNYTLVKEKINEYSFNVDNHHVDNMVFRQYFFYLSFEVHYQIYANKSYRYYLKKEETKDYFNSGILTNSKEYTYDSGYDGRVFPVSTIKATSTNGKTLITKTDYPQDLPGETYMNNLIAAHRIAEPVQTRVYRGDSNGNPLELLSNQKTRYTNSNGLYLPQQIKSAKGGNDLENRITYNRYDSYGNPIEVSKLDGMHIAYVWGYNGQYPIAKIENSSYAGLPTQKRNDMIAFSNNPNKTEQQILAKMEEFRNYVNNSTSNKMVTTYTYKPIIGVSTVTDPKGDTQFFKYDESGRLKRVLDEQGNFLQEHEYHYRPQ